MHNVVDLECKRNVEICDDILKRERDGICGMNDDSWFLERSEGCISLRADPMLKEASLSQQTGHGHAQELNLYDDISEDYTSSFGEAKNQFFSGDEYYDESWLFGKESWFSLCMRLFILKFSIKRVVNTLWFGADKWICMIPFLSSSSRGRFSSHLCIYFVNKFCCA